MSLFSSVTHAENSKRKSHRITIPIQAIINNKTYIVNDWSMNGLKIQFNDDESENISVGDVLNIKIILPTIDASIVLDMEVTVRNLYLDVCGMEITKISEKNRKVIRHYATLAIDGNIDHVDNLSGNLFMSNVPSPIKEPIQMSDKEHKEVHKSFYKKFILNIGISLIFFSVVAIIFFYNFLLIRDTSGFIAGNSIIYYAPYDGVLKNIYVKKDEKINRNQILFEMQDRDYLEQINILKQTQEKLSQELNSYIKILKGYEKYSQEKLTEMNSIRIKEIDQIKENYVIQEQTYNRAKHLYNEQLLSYKDFLVIENRYMSYKDEYNSIINQKRTLNKNVLTLEQNYNKNQDHIISVKNSIVLLKKEIESNKLKISNLNRYVKDSVMLSKSKGIVYNISRNIGDSLNYADNIMIVETDTKPFVLLKFLSTKVSDINIGTPCIIKTIKDEKLYKAHITGIGYPAIDGINLGANELSQNDVPIKVEFDNDVRFRLNEYVHVYIINDSVISHYLVKNITGIIFND